MAISQNFLYYIALSHFPKFGPKSLGQILQNKKDYKKLFLGSTKDFSGLKIPDKYIQDFFNYREKINLTEIESLIKKEGVEVITPKSQEYPPLLKEIHNPPSILFCKGDLSAFMGQKISIVGSRKLTPYGEQIVAELLANLYGSGLKIVSGLALGIDAEAHKNALQNKLKTIAVLGTGVNDSNIYPRSNFSLAKKIIKDGGLVISEFPFGTVGLKYNFPQRNRIISALSKITIVVEAAKKSGALITAYHALEQNRDVFAVPGSIKSSVSAGPNELIKQGAIPLTDTNNIREALDLDAKINYSKKDFEKNLSKEEKLIIKHLSSTPTHVDRLSRLTDLTISTINSTLTMMEINGLVKNVGNMQYVLLC